LDFWLLAAAIKISDCTKKLHCSTQPPPPTGRPILQPTVADLLMADE